MIHGTSDSKFINKQISAIPTYILSALLVIAVTAFILLSVKLLKDRAQMKNAFSAVSTTQKTINDVFTVTQVPKTEIRLNDNAAYSTIIPIGTDN